ncbi:YuzD family protein [Sporosarcina sp. GW1-11]|uniref:YuzD family protein n=1 Tax=Sporosarcina sp. GW1-11 TaxID=2899126 RepID=UPI00294E1F0A|nr:YuzD family protein [Sporosarcina sp. GW1-11]MDV6378915.1 YuzD family protein [Sporosarcina sp. GW1-11]
MSQLPVIIEVYGAEIQCASCVNAPSSKDTYEWLEAALSRKYPDQPFTITYIDIDQKITEVYQQEIAHKIREDEYYYPLVMINNEMVGEGHIQLKPVYQAMEANGYYAG